MSIDDANFRKQFDRQDPNFHGGLTTAVPTSDTKKVPESMMGEYQPPPGPDLSKLVFGAEYDVLMKEREQINKLKPAVNAVNRQVACMLVDLTKEKPKKDLEQGVKDLEAFYETFPKGTQLGDEITKVVEAATVEPNDELAKQVHKLTTGTTRLILQLLKPNLAAIKKIKKAVIDKAKADWKAEQAAAGDAEQKA
jgi:hypothetical protein